MGNDKIEITVVMPALNEEKNINSAVNDTLRAFKDFSINGEVIVVNDGSTDKTRDLVEKITQRDPCVKILNHPASQGIGASFWDGVDAARGDAVVVFPGDNENDPNEIFRYYKLLEHVDIVIPFIYNREVRPIFRNILSLIYRLIINITFLVNFNYTNGTVLYRKSILKGLDYRSKGFFFQTDILIRTVKKGYLFAEVPYRLGLRKGGDSKAVRFPALFGVVEGYFRLVKDYYFKKDRRPAIDYSGDSATTLRRRN